MSQSECVEYLWKEGNCLQIFEASLFCIHTQLKGLFFLFYFIIYLFFLFYLFIWKYHYIMCCLFQLVTIFINSQFLQSAKNYFLWEVHEHVSTVRFFFQHSWNYSSLSQGKALAVVGLGYLKMTTFAQTLVVQLLLKTNVFPFTSWLSLSLSLSLSPSC